MAMSKPCQSERCVNCDTYHSVYQHCPISTKPLREENQMNKELEVGKTYLDRSGSKVKIVSEVSDAKQSPDYDRNQNYAFSGDNHTWYTKNGFFLLQYSGSDTSQSDLVSEYIDTNTEEFKQEAEKKKEIVHEDDTPKIEETPTNNWGDYPASEYLQVTKRENLFAIIDLLSEMNLQEAHASIAYINSLYKKED